MSEAGFQRYLKETGKTIKFRYPVPIPQPEKSQLKLEQLLSEPRWWGAVVHNCEGLVEDIVVAGGGPRLHKGLMMLPSQSRPQAPRKHRSVYGTHHEFPF
jgi:hypothetical protein